MGNYLDKDGLTRFKEKMLTEVDKRIANGGGSTSGGDAPTKEEILEGATRVSDVEVNPEVATVEALQTGLSRVESNLGNLESNILDNSTIHIIETWRASDGKSWYRKWSDGWIEQGGSIPSASSSEVTITFPLSFIDTNYHISKNRYYNSSSNATIRTTGFYNETTTTATTYGSSGNKFSWYACGY